MFEELQFLGESGPRQRKVIRKVEYVRYLKEKKAEKIWQGKGK